MKGKILAILLLGGLPGAGAAQAADPILEGTPPQNPCAAALEGPDYVPGVDAGGQPVPRADAGARPVPVPGQILVPLPRQGGRGRAGGRGDSAYAALDGRAVDPLVNPPTPCPAPARR